MRTIAPDFATEVNDGNLRGALRVLGQQSADVQDTWPVIFHLDVTGRCNLSCLYCQRDFFLKTKHPFLKGDMSDEVFQALVPWFKHAKVVAMLSMLGEPLLVKELPRWWVQVVEAGAKPQTTTNGTYLTEELADVFASTGGRLKLSIDTFRQDTLNILRPRHSVDLLRDRLALVEQRRRAHPGDRLQLGVNLVITSKNLEHAVETVEECLRLARVDVFTFANFRMPTDEAGTYHRDAQPLSVDMGSSETTAAWAKLLSWAAKRHRSDGTHFIFPYSRDEWVRVAGPEASELFAESFEDNLEDGIERESYYCCVPWLKAHVMSDGSVIPCHLLHWPRPEMALGNVLEESFDKIWTGRAFRGFRGDMGSDKRAPECTSCRSWWRFYTPQRVE